jgi:large subunit ribosomal protein L10
MHKQEKERVVADLTERLKGSQALFVADYRGLTMPQIDGLRGELLKHGARFAVVKNTLTRRAAEEAGVEALLALLEGPSAIAFLESEGDPVAVAKAIGDAARSTRILTVRGGVLQGRAITADDVESLSKLPAAEVLQAQLVGVLAAPLTQIVGIFSAPLRDIVGVIDARIRQLEEGGGAPAPAEAEAQAEAPAEVEAEAPAAEEAALPADAAGEEPAPEADAEPAPGEPGAEAEPEPAAEAEAEPAAEAEAEPAAEAEAAPAAEDQEPETTTEQED